MLYLLSTITLEEPWSKAPVPKIPWEQLKASPWFEALANQVLTALFTIFEENMEWLILSLVLIAAVGFGVMLWRLLHPGPGPGPKGEDRIPGHNW